MAVGVDLRRFRCEPIGVGVSASGALLEEHPITLIWAHHQTGSASTARIRNLSARYHRKEYM